MATKHQSRIARIVHEAAADAHKAGVMDKTTMRKFDALCLAEVQNLSPKEIQVLRERENVSQAVLARYLNVTTGHSQWEDPRVVGCVAPTPVASYGYDYAAASGHEGWVWQSSGGSGSGGG